ncbi:hypothetical protein P4O66_003712, partial [Electrophorus voltai]
RDALISLDLHNTHLKPSLTPDPRWPTEILRENKGCDASKRPRRKRAGIRNRLRTWAHRAPLPSILLANVQPLDNKLDNLQVPPVPEGHSGLQPTLLHRIMAEPSGTKPSYRMDRTADSGKSRGGGVCVMVNNSWCNDVSVVTLARSCSSNLELLALKFHPFYIPHEFTSVIVDTVYIPPQANPDTALCELHEALTQFQVQHRDAALILVGDFNSANLKRAVSNLYQHVTFPTRGNRTPDHCYTPYKDSYNARAHPPFGESDHTAIFLIPKYKQRLKRQTPVQREVAHWTDQSVAALQDALDDADWNMFRRSTDDVSKYTEAVVGFIGKLVDDTISKATIKMFPNQTPWVDKTICEDLNSRTAAYNMGIISGNMDEYKSGAYGVRRCFKRSTIVAVPKKSRPSGLNNYRPVALTLVVMKCFEKLVRDFITSSLPASMDPLQFGYSHNRFTDDAITHLLQTILTHLDKGRGNYVKMLFVDYNSAFNTIILSLLTTKLEDLGLHPSLCDWISNFLTDRPQLVQVGKCVSCTLPLSTGAPQGCVLSPLLYSLYTHDCVATSSSTIIVKFADDTVVMGLISENNERAYLEEKIISSYTSARQ